MDDRRAQGRRVQRPYALTGAQTTPATDHAPARMNAVSLPTHSPSSKPETGSRPSPVPLDRSVTRLSTTDPIIMRCNTAQTMSSTPFAWMCAVPGDDVAQGVEDTGGGSAGGAYGFTVLAYRDVRPPPSPR